MQHPLALLNTVFKVTTVEGKKYTTYYASSEKFATISKMGKHAGTQNEKYHNSSVLAGQRR